MNLSRRCSKTACRGPAVATLTYVYSDRAAVLGPFATYAEPHTYDLCWSSTPPASPPPVAGRSSASSTDYPEPQPTTDDLLALADAVREAGRPRTPAPDPVDSTPAVVPGEVRRGHLRVLRGSAEG